MNEALIDQDRVKAAEFLGKAESGALQAGLSPEQRKKVNEYVIQQRNIYVNQALVAKEYDKTSPAYLEAIQTMNTVRNNLSNLAAQQKKISENQQQYLDDFQSDRISKANYEGNDASLLMNVYTGKAALSIDEGGNLLFGDGKNFKKYDEIANYALKAYDTSNKLLDISDKIYNAKNRLSGAAMQQVKNRVSSMIEKGGRKELLSLIQDELIPGLSPDSFDKSLYLPENYDLLKSDFINKFGSALDQVNGELKVQPTKTTRQAKPQQSENKRKNIFTEYDVNYFTSDKSGEESEPFYFTMPKDKALGYNEYKSPKHTLQWDNESSRWVVNTPGHAPYVLTEQELRAQFGVGSANSNEQSQMQPTNDWGSYLNKIPYK